MRETGAYLYIWCGTSIPVRKRYILHIHHQSSKPRMTVTNTELYDPCKRKLTKVCRVTTYQPFTYYIFIYNYSLWIQWYLPTYHWTQVTPILRVLSSAVTAYSNFMAQQRLVLSHYRCSHVMHSHTLAFAIHTVAVNWVTLIEDIHLPGYFGNK